MTACSKCAPDDHPAKMRISSTAKWSPPIIEEIAKIERL